MGWPIKLPAAGFLAYALASFFALGAASGAPTKVFILAGQSNMAGFGLVSQLGTRYREFPNIRLYLSLDAAPSVSSFSKLAPGNSGFPAGSPIDPADFPNNSFPATFGPELGIAEVLTAKYPNDKLAFVKIAYGGTSLTRKWVGNEAPEYVYTWFQNRMKEAMTDLIAATGGDYELCGIVWMQGESDAVDFALSRKGVYKTNLENLVDVKFRRWLASQGYMIKPVNGVIPFALGQIKLGPTWRYASEINAEIFRAQSSIAGVICTDGPTRAVTYPTPNPPQSGANPFNPAHYNRDGQLDVGASLGKAIAEALDGKTKGCRSPFSPSDVLSQVLDD